ncbi:hypothetical protein [Evansella tamaricis]|nr:hypothetical protein [Evansella tamaricis]
MSRRIHYRAKLEEEETEIEHPHLETANLVGLKMEKSRITWNAFS